MTTKLELSQLLATRNTELEAARLRISVLEGNLHFARANTAIKTVARVPWVRPAHMEAARQAAMSGHCVVKL